MEKYVPQTPHPHTHAEFIIKFGANGCQALQTWKLALLQYLFNYFLSVVGFLCFL